MRYTIDEQRFLDLMLRMLGKAGIERVNRNYCKRRGFGADEISFLRMRSNLATVAMMRAGLLPASMTVSRDEFTFDFRSDDEKAVLFRLRWL